MEENISYLISFGAGVLTFFSPCFLPLIPSYIVYISGVSVDEIKDHDKIKNARWKILAHGIFFSLGFSVIFTLLGMTATFIGRALFEYQKAISIAGGAFIIIFGLHFLGILNFDFLMKEKKFAFRRSGVGYLGSFLIGVTFAAAWTPCVGPILGSILVFAGSKADMTTGASLLAVYSLGIAVPFLVSSFLIGVFLPYFSKAQKLIAVIRVVGGALMVILGIGLMTGYYQKAAILIQGLLY
ncbi:cytochrome c biogenesis CcdA family protein [Candidatus Omnitrophota bacterium]